MCKQINKIVVSLYLIYENPLKQEMVYFSNIWQENSIAGGRLCTSVKINEFSLLIICTSNLLPKVSKDSHGAVVSFCIFCYCVISSRDM